MKRLTTLMKRYLYATMRCLHLSAFMKRYVYAAVYCLYLFITGLFCVAKRCALFNLCAHFGYDEQETVIPKVKLSEIVSENAPIRILESTGMVSSFFETVAIAKLIKQHKPRSLFEIGTFVGGTTLNMAANSADEAKVYTLDLPKDKLNSTKLPIRPDEKWAVDKDGSGAKFLGTEYEKKITQLYGDSATFDFSPFTDTIDFVFIDGSHSYEYVLNDSEKALRLLRNGKGVILWHDYYSYWDGLVRALNELYLKDTKFKGLKHITGTTLACLTID